MVSPQEMVSIFHAPASNGAYVDARNVQCSENGRTYSVNEAYSLTFPRGVQKYLNGQSRRSGRLQPAVRRLAGF